MDSKEEAFAVAPMKRGSGRPRKDGVLTKRPASKEADSFKKKIKLSKTERMIKFESIWERNLTIMRPFATQNRNVKVSEVTFHCRSNPYKFRLRKNATAKLLTGIQALEQIQNNADNLSMTVEANGDDQAIKNEPEDSSETEPKNPGGLTIKSEPVSWCS